MTTSSAETAKSLGLLPPPFPNHSIGLTIPETWVETKTGRSTNGASRKRKTTANQNRTAVLFGNLEAYGMRTVTWKRSPLQRGEGDIAHRSSGDDIVPHTYKQFSQTSAAHT